MSPARDPHLPGIGAQLKDARRRIGMDVKEAEERTKIRARYLRALEAEEWEILPGAAYIRGFLRTYGTIIGLDGEALADEFRRSYEEREGLLVPSGSEPVLQERRRPSGARRQPGARPPSRGPLIAAVAVGIVVLLIILGSLGGDDPPARSGAGGGVAGKGPKRAEKANREQRPAPLQPIAIRVEPLATVRACLVADGRQALIDGQTLAPGAVGRFSDATRYRLDLDGGGTVKLTAGGESQRLEAGASASFEADSRGIREIDYAGPDCP